MTTETRPSLTKVTVNLIPDAMNALNAAADQTGDSRTDTINRALQVYAQLVQEQGDGDGRELRLSRPARGRLARLLGLRVVRQFTIIRGTASNNADQT